MDILVLGGTRFVGGAIVERLAEAGHRVTRLHRGRSPGPELPGVSDLVGDRDADLSALMRGTWDATIDVSAYRPGQVEGAARALDGRGGHYVLISSVSAYSESIGMNATEDAPLADTGGIEDPAVCEIDPTTYGPLKALCERAGSEVHDRFLVVRPTYVIGPRDHTMRFPHWVRTIAAGGEVRCPEPRQAPLQYVDARDLATFVQGCVERGSTGVVHACSRPLSFEGFLAGVAEGVGGPGLEWAWESPATVEQGVEDFPLWTGPAPSPLMALDPAHAESLGLACRPLAATAADTLGWLDS